MGARHDHIRAGTILAYAEEALAIAFGGWNIEGLDAVDGTFHLWVHNGPDSNRLIVSRCRAKAMLADVTLALEAAEVTDELVLAAGVPFSWAECRALRRVLTGLLVRVGEAQP